MENDKLIGIVINLLDSTLYGMPAKEADKVVAEAIKLLKLTVHAH